MRRPTAARRSAAAALAVAAVPLALAGCSAAPAATGSATPPDSGTTRAGSTSSGPTSDAPLTPPSSLVPPRVHAPAAVASYLAGHDLTGLARTDQETVTKAVVRSCPGGPTVARDVGPTAYARAWEGPGGVRADVAALTYPDLASAATAVEPLLDAAAGCRAPRPAQGVTTTVANQRRDVAEGMPLGRVDVTRTSPDETRHDYVGVVQVGNVLVRLTYSAPDAKAATGKGSTALALLARGVHEL
jgi:hypothetical protein